MTTVLAAGFSHVSEEYDVSPQKVAFTTGLYMLGLGLGSVVMSPTAILFGKRPVYLLGAVLFVLSAVWCAASPNYISLVLARIFQGIAVSPVECLPSATIAEIYFLHERAYRVGIYTFLLLGGKNLVPLVSAAIIDTLGWRWVFWVVAIIVGGCLVLLFFFVPETFWDRTPRPRRSTKRPNMYRSVSDLVSQGFRGRHSHVQRLEDEPEVDEHDPDAITPVSPRRQKQTHVGFAAGGDEATNEKMAGSGEDVLPSPLESPAAADPEKAADPEVLAPSPQVPPSATLREPHAGGDAGGRAVGDLEAATHGPLSPARSDFADPSAPVPATLQYTNKLRERPRISFAQSLKPFSGQIARDNWLRVAFRPFVLYAYPSVLWSSMVYALSVGWLIVLSEVVSHIFESGEVYNFTALQTGLIYISPFVGGLIGTMVAGKVSDIIVRFMTRRNGGVYEPEFRLVMAIPIALSTVIGLMGFGWSAQERDLWIVPTIFFGIISFGCCLGSTTSITFCVDSYRQYAGEALVTLNFSKSKLPTRPIPCPFLTGEDVLHGLVFSLFIVGWLKSDGAQTVFLVLGGIQLGLLLLTIPMYIYGKRARMWTVRKRLMEKF